MSGPGRRVAFYAPLKPPDHPVPSGDRRMARALMAALAEAGWDAELVSRLRSYDRAGDAGRQARLQAIGAGQAKRLATRLARRPAASRPVAWLTYHAYHKSPDWLGPTVSRALGIPYLLVEASHAAKQAHGHWQLGHAATAAAVRQAAVVLAMTEVDAAGLAPLLQPPQQLRRLPPFLDPAPYAAARLRRAEHRQWLAAAHQSLDPAQPWLLAVGMMRPDAKRDSYRLLAAALDKIKTLTWQLIIVGDGIARAEVEEFFQQFTSRRVSFVGFQERDSLLACYAAADVYVWPAVREAYGLAILEAQAAGLPVVAGHDGGVAEVVRAGVTGLLPAAGNASEFAAAVAELLAAPERRAAMAAAAVEFVAAERAQAAAARLLDQALQAALAGTVAGQ